MTDGIGSGKTSEFLRGVYQGLKEADGLGRGKEATARANAVVAAAKKIDPDAILTPDAIDRLGLDPGLRASLIFQLLHDRYPQEVGSAVRAAKTLSGVFAALIGADAETLEGEGDLNPPERIQAFVDRLFSLDERYSETGEEVLKDADQLILNEVVDRESPIALDVTLHETDTKDTLQIQLEGESWKFHWVEGEREGNVKDWDLHSAEKLLDALEPLSSEGSKDPLLALHRAELEQEEGNVFPELIAFLKHMIKDKIDTRRGHLAALDTALREHLGKYRVGETSKEAIDQVGDKLNGGE
jgi:hypothetical protein